MLSLLHLQTHGDRFETWHAISKLGWCESQVERHGGTGDGIFYGCLVNEGDGVGVFLALIDVGYCRGVRSEE